MTRWQQTMEVARWEFARFIKWRQQFIGLALMFVVAGIAAAVGSSIRNAESKPVAVVVLGREALGYALPSASPVVWDTSRTWDAKAARQAVADETVDGALIVSSGTALELVMRRRAAWSEPLEQAFTAARQQAALSRLATTPEEQAELFAPLTLRTEFVTAGAAPVARSTRIAALVILFVGLIILFSGFGTLFTGITGEKQHRVTEQLMAMVPPQVWMDGKILGLSAAAITGTALTLAGFAVLGKALPSLLGRSAIALPPIASDYGTLALILVVTLLGVGMWFSFMAAIAATIDDPNSSTRTLLLFVPMLPLGVAFGLLQKMDSVAAQFFAVLPLTSMAVLPVRLVLTTVPPWEVLLSVTLLIGAVWAFRRAAGKIFGTAMLMYGKEPTFAELLRWLRQA